MNRLAMNRRQLLQVSSGLAVLAALPGCATRQPKPPAITNFANIPRSDYEFATTCDEVVAGMDLSGMTVLITGCNSGLGFETMRVLAASGAHVIGAARTEQKAIDACNSVSGKTTPVVCELTNMESVVACSEFVADLGEPLDVLYCNAGIMALPDLEQVDVNGVILEKQFVVNHLGHYLLTRRLLPQVMDAPAPRIVTVSSTGYALAPEGGILFDNLSGNEFYQPFQFYGQSKLSNILLANELSRRYSNELTANAIHPGVVATNLGRYMRRGKPRDPNEPLRKGFKRPDQGAATQVYVGVDPRIAGVTGFYFEDCNPVETKGDYAQNLALANRLWEVSQELVAPYLS